MQDRTRDVGRWVARFGPQISFVVWLCSLALPAFIDTPHEAVLYPGLMAFLMGWGYAPVAWLANPLLWLAYVAGSRGHPGWAARLAIAAVVCAIVGVGSFLILGSINGSGIGWQLLIGVPVWIASMVILVISSALRVRYQPANPTRGAA